MKGRGEGIKWESGPVARWERYYPICLNVEGWECVVVGGGEVAARRAQALVEAGARVRAVAPWFCRLFRDLVGVERLEREYDESLLLGARLVIAATDRKEVNAAVSRHARRMNILVNVVDEPGLSDFIVPAVVRRGRMALAISTGGAFPALAGALRRELEETYPPGWGELVELLGWARGEIRRRIADPGRRHRLLRRLAEQVGGIGQPGLDIEAGASAAAPQQQAVQLGWRYGLRTARQKCGESGVGGVLNGHGG